MARSSRALFALGFGTFAIGSGWMVVAGLVSALADHFQVSAGHAGQLVTLFALAYAIGAPLTTAVFGGQERRRLLGIGLGLFILGNLFAAVSDSFGELVLARVVSACGAALFVPAAMATAVQLADPHRRGRAIGIAFGGFTIASVVGAPLGTWLGLTFGWRMAFMAVAGLATAALASVMLSVPSRLRSARATLGTWADLLQSRRILLAVSTTGLLMAAQFVAFTYITPLLHFHEEIDAADVTRLLAWYGLAGVAGNIVAGKLADRVGSERAIAYAIAGMGIAFATLPLMHGSMTMAYVCLAIWGFAGFSFQTPQQMRLANLAPQSVNALLSINSSAMCLGQAAGAITGGLTLAASGPANLNWVSLAVVAIAAGIFALSRAPRRQPA